MIKPTRISWEMRTAYKVLVENRNGRYQMEETIQEQVGCKKKSEAILATGRGGS
jgi:hypothetical protein